ncbi:MAG: TRAP transporter large permease subunit [Ignavibacteria bacterium]|nr:TRAP transporter large permease subunit [Ignavibacteria bacterium]
MPMPFELIILLSMLVTFALGVFLAKLPSGVALVLSAIVGALVAGEGFPLRHLVEGAFGYLDAVLIIATAMIFMKVFEASGALGTLGHLLMKSLYRWPTLLFVFIALFVMFPGMLTGLSSACILTTGALVAPAMLAMRIPPPAVGSFIAMLAVYGMIAPPINIPVMIIGGGVDMPYIGFDTPLAIASFPLALVAALYYRFRYVRKIQIDEVLSKLPSPVHSKHGVKLFAPLVLVVVLMVAIRVVPQYIPDIGIPLIFLLGSLVGLFTGERMAFWPTARAAVRDAMPVMVILVGVGMFVQIMTLTGVRGFLAVGALNLPPAFLYVGIALLMPAFGSAYASASVLGVPLVYVFLGKDEIVVTSALSLIAGLGDLMPPPMLLCAFASQIVGEKNQFKILKQSLPLMVLSLLVAIAMIAFANSVARMY